MRFGLVRAATVALVAILIGWTKPVLAAPPVREPLAFPDATGLFCEDFPVLVQAVENRNFITTFSDGRTHITGTIIIELTNLTTDKSIVVNSSGPATFSEDGATITLVGPFVLFGEAGFFGPGSPAQLTLNHGSAVVSLADLTILSQVGHSEDLCPVLADP
jgi:hypothetical protein